MSPELATYLTLVLSMPSPAPPSHPADEKVVLKGHITC